MAGGWRLYEYYEQKYREEQRQLPWYQRDILRGIALALFIAMFVLGLFYLKIARIL